MPVYEYLCDDCGPFKDLRPMAECDDPQSCPHCETMAPRVILTAPNFFCMPAEKRKAHAVNERSTHAPQTLAQYKASHGRGCGQDREGQGLGGQEEARAAGDQNQERRQGISHRVPLDDQPLTHATTSSQ